ncbi:DUF1513 domain-containing protein [Terasakiella sp. A23]|uniref:DUF1513 domain-containing protein n=1 Tax=Terasakiella sp. FCG-A23 TaxID=3080561 RepID=UPI002954B81C|nr:DUF1513 domain-containing protein [Terasakiella sp. A23]MDV7340238.1 DUF1513 domain-containing protein [Terasakiella sp. A23]
MQRRHFLKGTAACLAGTIFPTLPHAAPLSEGWYSGFKDDKGQFGVAHIAPDLRATALFYTPLRLHGISLNTSQNLIIAPARRPDTALYVFEMAERTMQVVTATKGRHYYGHGVFDEVEPHYYTTENDYQNERGVIGIYEFKHGFKRIGEWSSGGIGPHQILQFEKHLIVANGGILTYPEMGRAKLNIDSMAPNLTYINTDTGQIEQKVRLPADLHKLSIRHIDVNAKGEVFIALQDQLFSRSDVPLVWKVSINGVASPLPAPESGWNIFKGYIGSISAVGDTVCATSPRGNVAYIWQKNPLRIDQNDICGIAPTGTDSFLFSAGDGTLRDLTGRISKQALHFDNHLSLI